MSELGLSYWTCVWVPFRFCQWNKGCSSGRDNYNHYYASEHVACHRHRRAHGIDDCCFQGAVAVSGILSIVGSLLLRSKSPQAEAGWLQGKLWVDVGYWGGIVPQNAANHSVLQGLLDAGALGFKSFMSPSGAHWSPSITLRIFQCHYASSTNHSLELTW